MANSKEYLSRPDVKVKMASAAKRYRSSPKGQAKRGEYYRRWQAKYNAMKYGLSEQQIERMFADQGGVCACCGDEISLIPKSDNIRHIDHNHSKKKGDPGFIRGLLCDPCNSGLGCFRDLAGRLKLAVKYLEEHP